MTEAGNNETNSSCQEVSKEKLLHRADTLSMLLMGDFDVYDDTKGHVIEDQVYSAREPIYSKYFPPGSIFEEKVSVVRQLFHRGWDLYALSRPSDSLTKDLAKQHKKVKAVFPPHAPDFEHTCRRFLRRFAYGLSASSSPVQDPVEIALGLRRAIEANIGRRKDHEKVELQTVCGMILDGRLPLDAASYIAKKK